jgi:hypothetical protein
MKRRRPLTDALLSAPEPAPAEFSLMEARLVKLTASLIPDAMIQVRVADVAPEDLGTGAFPPITAERYARATLWAFRAACELEGPLREIRDQIGASVQRPELLEE